MQYHKDYERENGGILDVLFDPYNTDEITLVNEKGQTLVCKQVYATVKDDAVYCILAPVVEVSGLAKDAAFAFLIDPEQTLTVVKNGALSEQIFLEYYNSAREGGK